MIIFLLLAVIIAILLFNSFSKFNAWVRKYENLLSKVESELKNNPDDFILHFKKAECLMCLQQYYSAANEYRYVLSRETEMYVLMTRLKTAYLSNFKSDILINLDFCVKPLAWSKDIKYDEEVSYIHYLLLDVAGNHRVFSAFLLN